MKIGIDLDDTLTNRHYYLIKYGKKYNRKILKKSNKSIDIHQYYEKDIFNWSETETKKFKEYFNKNILPKIPPRVDAKKYLKKMIRDGHEIFIITGRNCLEFKNPYQETKIWLDKNKITYTKIFINAKNKDSICLKEKIDLLVDDRYKYCIQASNANINVLMFENLYNSSISEFTHVKTYKEIYIKKDKYDNRK